MLEIGPAQQTLPKLMYLSQLVLEQDQRYCIYSTVLSYSNLNYYTWSVVKSILHKLVKKRQRMMLRYSTGKNKTIVILTETLTLALILMLILTHTQ